MSNLFSHKHTNCINFIELKKKLQFCKSDITNGLMNPIDICTLITVNSYSTLSDTSFKTLNSFTM